MDIDQLKIALIDAAQARPYNHATLMNLIEEHQPDFSCDEFQVKNKQRRTRKLLLFNKQLNSQSMSGAIAFSDVDGFFLNKQQHLVKRGKTVIGYVLIQNTGQWIYQITDKNQLDTITNGGYVQINQNINIHYFKEMIVHSVGHIVSAYISEYGTGDDMQKVLDFGCCPNLNQGNQYDVIISYGKTPQSDYLPYESRALVNCIKQGKLDLIETLIDHPCHCCNGAGAKVTQNLIDMAQELNQDAIHEKLLQAVN